MKSAMKKQQKLINNIYHKSPTKSQMSPDDFHELEGAADALSSDRESIMKKTEKLFKIRNIKSTKTHSRMLSANQPLTMRQPMANLDLPSPIMAEQP